MTANDLTVANKILQGQKQARDERIVALESRKKDDAFILASHEGTIKNLHSDNVALKKEIERLKGEAEVRASIGEERYYENKKLQAKLTEKDKEIEKLKLKIASLENTIGSLPCTLDEYRLVLKERNDVWAEQKDEIADLQRQLKTALSDASTMKANWDAACNDIGSLQHQVKVLREALEWYADFYGHTNKDGSYLDDGHLDDGHVARQALKDSQ